MIPSVVPLALALLSVFDPASAFRGGKVIRVMPTLETHVQALRNLQAQKRGLDFLVWRPATVVDRNVDIYVNQSWTALESILNQLNVSFQVLFEDTSQEPLLQRAHLYNAELFDKNFQPYNPLVAEMKRIVALHSEVASILMVGHSFQKRPIYAIKIQASSPENSSQRPLLFLNCGIHGREWLAVSTCMFLIKQIVYDYKHDSELASMLSNMELIILPVLNVDGYEYSHTNDRFWRKTRSINPGGGCRGADPNRNFNFRWGGAGASNYPCSETYSGPYPFSEIEVLSLARYLYSRRRVLKGFLDIHTYGQLWMSPWSFTSSPNQHVEIQRRAMASVINAIGRTPHRGVYTSGTASTLLYETTGDSTDWVYGFLGVVHTYAVELRPRYEYPDSYAGFRPSAMYTPVAGEEMLAAVRALYPYIVGSA